MEQISGMGDVLARMGIIVQKRVDKYNDLFENLEIDSFEDLRTYSQEQLEIWGVAKGTAYKILHYEEEWVIKMIIINPLKKIMLNKTKHSLLINFLLLIFILIY